MGIFLGPAIIACLVVDVIAFCLMAWFVKIAMRGPFRIVSPIPARGKQLLAMAWLLIVLGLGGIMLVVLIEQNSH